MGRGGAWESIGAARRGPSAQPVLPARAQRGHTSSRDVCGSLHRHRASSALPRAGSSVWRALFGLPVRCWHALLRGCIGTAAHCAGHGLVMRIPRRSWGRADRVIEAADGGATGVVGVGFTNKMLRQDSNVWSAAA